MKLPNKQVANAWSRNETATNHKGSYHTDGNDLYSYDLRIGYTLEDGTKVLLDYTAATGNFQSQTTSSKHVWPARAVADVVLSPSDPTLKWQNLLRFLDEVESCL